MVKNGDKLYYPIKEAITSILPMVDEFVIALGDCDEDDKTLELIESIQSPKIKIIHTVWDLKAYPQGMENAHQTDIAKSQCSGDWLFYLQADEVVHEKDHASIVNRCEQLLYVKEIDALLFRYYHFWADYRHYHRSHGWYDREIRIIRNDPEIHSWKSAQSFRRIPDFDGLHYRMIDGTQKLNVAEVDAHIYHYGFVRPPDFMWRKKISLAGIHHGKEVSEKLHAGRDVFEYGALKKIPVFKGTHPVVMQNKIQKFDWAEQLNYSRKKTQLKRALYKHEKLKYQIISAVENNIFGGNKIFTSKNYRLINI